MNFYIDKEVKPGTVRLLFLLNRAKIKLNKGRCYYEVQRLAQRLA